MMKKTFGWRKYLDANVAEAGKRGPHEMDFVATVRVAVERFRFVSKEVDGGGRVETEEFITLRNEEYRKGSFNNHVIKNVGWYFTRKIRQKMREKIFVHIFIFWSTDYWMMPKILDVVPDILEEKLDNSKLTGEKLHMEEAFVHFWKDCKTMAGYWRLEDMNQATVERYKKKSKEWMTVGPMYIFRDQFLGSFC